MFRIAIGSLGQVVAFSARFSSNMASLFDDGRIPSILFGIFPVSVWRWAHTGKGDPVAGLKGASTTGRHEYELT